MKLSLMTPVTGINQFEYVTCLREKDCPSLNAEPNEGK